MNRHKIFISLIEVIENDPIYFNEVNFLDTYISPLLKYISNLYDPSFREEKYFSELKLIGKLKMFPDRFKSRILNPIQEKKYQKKYTKEITKDEIENSIIFIPTELNHLDQMLPVTREMKRKGIKFIYLTNKLNVLQKFINLSNDQIFYCTLSDKLIETRYKENEIEICSELIQFQNKLIVHFGIENAGKIINFLKEKIKQFIDTVLFYNKLVRIGFVKGIVVGNDLSVDGRIGVNVFRKNNIKSYCLMHGRVGDDEPLHRTHIANVFIVFGNASYKDLMNIGNKPDTLFIGGAPYLDEIYSTLNGKKVNNSIQKKLKLSIEEPIVLVTLSGPGHCTTFNHFNRIVNSIFEFASENLNYQLIFKLHPKDTLENYVQFIEKYKIENVKVIEHNAKGFPKLIFDWISGIDALITGSSSVAVEAMLLDKPVITIDYNQEYKNVDFIEEGCTIKVSKEIELTNVLLNIKSGNPIINSAKSKGKIFVQNYFANIGSSSEIIKDKIVYDCLN